MSSSPPTFQQLITPDPQDVQTLVLIAIYAVAILFLWNVPYLRYILYPFKLITVALHEFGHAAAGCCTGAKIQGITVDPEEGGATTMTGGRLWCTLPAGYLGSSFFGALMVFAGFDVLASKIVSIFIAVCLLATLWWAKNWLTRGLTTVFIVMIIVLWIVANGVGLTYFVLFMGVMSCFYSLWDIVEDLVLRKVNESDATKFAKYTGFMSPRFWGFVWFVVSLIFCAAAVILGIVIFNIPGVQQQGVQLWPSPSPANTTAT